MTPQLLQGRKWQESELVPIWDNVLMQERVMRSTNTLIYIQDCLLSGEPAFDFGYTPDDINNVFNLLDDEDRYDLGVKLLKAKKQIQAQIEYSLNGTIIDTIISGNSEDYEVVYCSDSEEIKELEKNLAYCQNILSFILPITIT